MDRHGNLAIKERVETLSTRLRKIEPVETGELLYEEPITSLKPTDEERNRQIDAAYEYIHGKYKAGLSKPDIAMRGVAVGFMLGVVLTLLTIYLVQGVLIHV